MKQLEALLFDLDDTLLVDEADVNACLLRVCGQITGADSEALAGELRRAARELWRACPYYEFGLALGVASWEALCSTFPGEHPALRALRDWAPAFRRQAWRAALGCRRRCRATGDFTDDRGAVSYTK